MAVALLSRDEAFDLLRPYSRGLMNAHETAYKRRDGMRFARPDCWADLRASTRGMVATDLVVAGARAEADEERLDWDLLDENSTTLVMIRDYDRPAAYLRFRSIEFEYDQYGELQPRMKGTLTDVARTWFGNDHVFQPRLGDSFSTMRPATNLLVGHAADADTGELQHVIVACHVGKRVKYWFPVDAQGYGGQGGTPFRNIGPKNTGGPRPTITPKRQPGETRSV